jgi:hypothetical protein
VARVELYVGNHGCYLTHWPSNTELECLSTYILIGLYQLVLFQYSPFGVDLGLNISIRHRLIKWIQFHCFHVSGNLKNMYQEITHALEFKYHEAYHFFLINMNVSTCLTNLN